MFLILPVAYIFSDGDSVYKELTGNIVLTIPHLNNASF